MQKLVYANSYKHFRVFIIYFPILFVHYFLSQTFLASFTTQADIFVSGLFPIIILFVLGTKGYLKSINQGSVLIILFFCCLLLSALVSQDPINSFRRSISLFVQVIFIYLMPKKVLMSLDYETKEKCWATAFNYIFIISMVGVLLNFYIVIVGKINNSFIYHNIIIGDYINGRYMGVMNTSAFFTSIGVLALFVVFLKTNNKLFRLIAMCVSFSFFILGGSRSGFLSGITFLVVYYFYASNSIRKCLYLMIFYICLVYMLFFTNVFEFLNDLNTFSSSRLFIWKAITTDTITLFGNGLSSNGIEIFSVRYYGGAHNAFLELLYTSGMLATLFMIVFIIERLVKYTAMRKFAINSIHKEKYLTCFSFVLAMLCYSMFESHLFFLRFCNVFMFWFALLTLDVFIVEAKCDKS